MGENEVSKVFDTVIVGGGISGLTVGYRLKERDILVLEREDVCGGRTISRKLGEYVYNTGAQVITGEDNLVAPLADELGVQKTLIAKSKLPIAMKGRLIASSSGVGFLWKLPIPLMQKIKLGMMVFNVKRKYGNFTKELPDLDDPRVVKLNSITLADYIGTAHPDLVGIWDAVSRATTTLHPHEVSAYHPLSTFVHFMQDEYYVEGGTWELTKALWKQVEDKTETSAQVEEVVQEGDRVKVTYEQGGQRKTVQARRCVVSVPGPLALSMVKDLPQAKRDALTQADFGSMTSAGFLVSEPSENILGEGVWRVPVVGKGIITVTNPTFTFPKEVKERTGQGLLRVYTGDEESKRLMQMSDGEALESLAGQLISTLPAVESKIITGSLKHWEHAGSPWRVGRIQLIPALQAPTGNIHYCGDYTDGWGMDGAVHSASRVLEELGHGPLFPQRIP